MERLSWLTDAAKYGCRKESGQTPVAGDATARDDGPSMLVFIDESGDSGLKIDRGSSRYFVIALVAFKSREEADSCDRRITALKKESGLEDEFHFHRNADSVRRAFLSTIAFYDFFYDAVVIDKARIGPTMFRNRDAFYRHACTLVFENTERTLSNATVVIDSSGSAIFRQELGKYLKRQLNRSKEQQLIRKVKMQSASANNLLQIADFAAGIINRSVQGEKKHAEEYRRILRGRERSVQIWPR